MLIFWAVTWSLKKTCETLETQHVYQVTIRSRQNLLTPSRPKRFVHTHCNEEVVKAFRIHHVVKEAGCVLMFRSGKGQRVSPPYCSTPWGRWRPCRHRWSSRPPCPTCCWSAGSYLSPSLLKGERHISGEDRKHTKRLEMGRTRRKIKNATHLIQSYSLDWKFWHPRQNFALMCIKKTRNNTKKWFRQVLTFVLHCCTLTLCLHIHTTSSRSHLAPPTRPHS